MAALDITIYLSSPLITGEPRQGSVMQTHTYLPGSVLRGAVAAALIKDWTPEQRAVPHPEHCPDRDACPLCRVLFPLQGQQPRFFDCHPVLDGSEAIAPFPTTAFTCKRFPGFLDHSLPDGDRLDHSHGIFDTLIRQAAARDAADSAQDIPYWFTLTCPHCAEPLKTPPGSAYGVLAGERYTAHPIVRRFSRTAINRRRSTAQQGQLFTLEVIGEQMNIKPPLHAQSADDQPLTVTTTFFGQVESGDADLNELRQALIDVSALGSGASRGLGQVAGVRVRRPAPPSGDSLTPQDLASQVQAQSFTASPNTDSLTDRIASFNAALASERDFYQAMGVDVLPGAWYFTIDLLSHAFICAAGLPSLLLTPQSLGLSGVDLHFHAAHSLPKGGWSNAWGLPRARQLAIGAGSVFLYQVNSSAPDDVISIIQKLHELERSGIGSDRARGAGRIQVCAPFHQEVQPV